MSSGYMTDSDGQAESGLASLEYVETIALLQEEIVRLESQLLDREEAGQIQPEVGGSCDDDVVPGDMELRQELARLGAEVAARDETINVLLDQLQLVEEAESASRAEWERLAAWVTEVEDRVERQAGAGTAPNDEELPTHRRLAEESLSQLERERESWKNQRLALEREIERLEEMVTRPLSKPGAPAPGADKAIAGLESENRRLRLLHQELEENARAETEALRRSLESVQQALAETRGELDVLRDDRDRERREFEIAMASLRAQVSRSSLVARETTECGSGTVATGDPSPALEADIRIRAFRQHLREIHLHEAEARKPAGLSARLSRLWSRTRPG